MQLAPARYATRPAVNLVPDDRQVVDLSEVDTSAGVAGFLSWLATARNGGDGGDGGDGGGDNGGGGGEPPDHPYVEPPDDPTEEHPQWTLEDILELLGDDPPRRWMDLDDVDHFTEMANRIYNELSARLRFDILVERERSGSLMDLG